MEIARLQEETAMTLTTPPDRGPKPNILHPNLRPLLPTPSPVSKVNTASRVLPRSLGNNTNGQRPKKFIPAAVRAEKMAKGLCYYCDQPFSIGHKCGGKTTYIFLVEVPGYDMAAREDSNEFSRAVNFDSDITWIKYL